MVTQVRKKGPFLPFFFLIGCLLSIFRQTIGGVNPFEMDIKMLIPALTSYLLTKINGQRISLNEKKTNKK